MAEVFYTANFKHDFKRLPDEFQRSAENHIQLLLQDRTHPSLRLKKVQGYEHLWEIRITRGYRITLSFQSNLIVLYRVGPHDILRHPI